MSVLFIHILIQSTLKQQKVNSHRLYPRIPENFTNSPAFPFTLNFTLIRLGRHSFLQNLRRYGLIYFKTQFYHNNNLYITIVNPSRCTNASNLFNLEWHSTCLGRSFRPSSGVQDCTYSNRHTWCVPKVSVLIFLWTN